VCVCVCVTETAREEDTDQEQERECAHIGRVRESTYTHRMRARERGCKHLGTHELIHVCF